MSGATSGSPGITLTPEETRLFGQLFSSHDTEATGVILGDAARPLFEHSGLPAKTLSQIWQLADTENRGFLDQIGFSKTLRMIYHVQHGKPLSPRLMTIPSGLPSFDHPAAPQLEAEHTAGSASGAPPVVNPSPSAPTTRIPPLNTADKQRFGTLFDRSTTGPTIDGAAAKDIFLKAHLSTEVLGKIWNLVDVQGRGSLTRNEFVLAMHIIQALISRTITEVPASLPEGWIPWLEGSASHASRGSVTSLNSVTSPPPAAPAAPPINWKVSSSQLKQYKQYFDSLDTGKKGVIGAAETVPFLTQSKLSEEVLAQVWDLADLQGQGQFSLVEFTIAMYLIQAKLAGHQLPEVLPPSLLETARGTSSSQVTSPVASPSPRLQPSGTGSLPAPPAARKPSRTTTAGSLNDLVSLDDYFKPLEPTPMQPTGSSVQSPQSTGMAPVQRPGYTGPGLPSSTSGTAGTGIGTGTGPVSAAAFVPTSSFGMKLFHGAPSSNNSRAVEEAQSSISGLNKDISDQQSKLAAVSVESKAADEQLAAVTAQKAQLEQQIGELRKNYDTEASKVHQTQQLLRQTQEAIAALEKDQKLRESGLQALQSQHEADSTKLAEAKTQHETLTARVAEIDEQHTTHKSTLEGLQTETEHLRGQTESYNQRIVAMETELQQTLDAIESAKLVRDDAEAKARAARERAERLETEVVATQQQHRGILAETEQLLTAAAADTKRAATAEHTVAETHAAIAAERSRQASTPTLSQRGLHSSPSARASSPGSAQYTQPTDTPLSSPPNSDYVAFAGEATAIPSFTLPMARPQSATSSVVNNAPLSVRGDLDISQPQSPDLTSEPVSGILPPETLDIEVAERDIEDTDSFEFVDARDGVHRESRDDAGRLASTGTLTGQVQSLSVSETDRVRSTSTTETLTPAPVDAPVAAPAVSAAAPAPKRTDDFATAFDDLEETVEDAEEDDFSGFGNATPTPAATGPDEWQKLFEDAPGETTVSASHDQAIRELTSMGFGHAEVLAALQRTEFNVSEATNILLDQE